MKCKINCSSSCDGRTADSCWHNPAALVQYLHEFFDVDLPVTRSVRLLDHRVDICLTSTLHRLHHVTKFVCGNIPVAISVEDFEGVRNLILAVIAPHVARRLEPLLLDLLRVDSPAMRFLNSSAGGSESRKRAGE